MSHISHGGLGPPVTPTAWQRLGPAEATPITVTPKLPVTAMIMMIAGPSPSTEFFPRLAARASDSSRRDS